MSSASSPFNSERRNELRRSLASKLFLTFANGQKAIGKGLDISAGGVGVVLDMALSEKTPCDVQFSLLGRDGKMQSWQATAKVTNCALSASAGGFRIGLQWVVVDVTVRKAIDQYLLR